jgi:hypothetical protein
MERSEGRFSIPLCISPSFSPLLPAAKKEEAERYVKTRVSTVPPFQTVPTPSNVNGFMAIEWKTE